MTSGPAPAGDATRPKRQVAGVTVAGASAPESLEDCAEQLRVHAARGDRLAFVGGGTALGLGNPPTGLDAVVDTRRLDRVVEYAPEDQIVVAEAGLTLEKLRSLLAEHRQVLGVDAPDPRRATLGGLVAAAGFGPRRMRYGALRDLLIGVTLVRADGELARGGGKVVKNVAGWDLPKVLCGSLGTLGLIARVTFRLHPKPECSTSTVLRLTRPERVFELWARVREAQLEPSSLVALGTAGDGFEVGVRFEGFEPGVRRDVQRLERVTGELGLEPGSRREPDADAFWRRHDELRAAGRDLSPSDLLVRITSLPNAFAQVSRWARPLLASLEGARLAWYASLGAGFVRGQVDDVATTLEQLTTLRAQLAGAGGALVIERAPGALCRSIDAWGEVGSAMGVMRELKLRFDPDGRLNPGRFVGGI